MVGGLSIINAAAGAYSDDLPFLVISGKTVLLVSGISI
jgi:TPP-dependent 2-oxoacid decarboxylase